MNKILTFNGNVLIF